MKGFPFFVLGLLLMFQLESYAQPKVSDVVNKYRNADVVNLKIKSSEWNELHNKMLVFEHYLQIINKKPELNELLNRADVTLLNDNFSYLVYIPVDSQTYFYSHFEFFTNMNKQELWKKEEYLKTYNFPVNTWDLMLYTPFENLMLNKKHSNKKLKAYKSDYIFDFNHFFNDEKVRLYINSKTLLIDSIHFQNSTKKIHFEYYKYNDTEMNQSSVFPIDTTNTFLKDIFAKKKFEHQQSQIRKDSILNSFNPVGAFNKLTLIDFWFIGCTPCHKSFPSVEKIRNTYSDTILDIKAYSYNNTQEEIDNYKKRYGFSFDMLPDSNNYILKFDIVAYPTKLLVTPEGEILYRSKGNRYDVDEYQLIMEIIDKYLNSKK